MTRKTLKSFQKKIFLNFLLEINPDHKSEVYMYNICNAFTIQYSGEKWCFSTHTDNLQKFSQLDFMVSSYANFL